MNATFSIGLNRAKHLSDTAAGWLTRPRAPVARPEGPPRALVAVRWHIKMSRSVALRSALKSQIQNLKFLGLPPAHRHQRH